MEVDAEVILTLQRQIRELRGQVEQLEYFRDQHMGTDAGQSGFNYPHPNQKVNVAEYGGGVMRLDKNGIQVVAPLSEVVGLWFTNTFSSSLPSDVLPRAYISGFNSSDDTDTHITKSARSTNYRATDILFATDANANAYADILAQGPGESAEIKAQVTLVSGTVTPRVSIIGAPLCLDSVSSDYSHTLLDGQEWYRSDIDTFRVRANGITRNLTMDGTNTTLTIATGAVTATTSFHAIDTEAAGATDDLDTISGGQTGQVLYIHAANGARDVVAKDGTGNLKLAGDFTMDNAEDTLTLIFDGTNWLELARSGNGA